VKKASRPEETWYFERESRSKEEPQVTTHWKANQGSDQFRKSLVKENLEVGVDKEG
jgi:hypothetical protein